jgi:hypothetical protein
VAVTVIGKDPTCVGVPERVPFVARLIPAGSVPLAREKVTVPTVFVAVNVWLKNEFAVPLDTAGFVTVIVWHEITSV